ncbi:hypothetical protein EDB82DRAFT_221151 [Fusarium venenatum]|uniref:uncharacterized protein n=1 Tax=Fusarium venenatum TaxID=56646 RepID=UPI001DDD97E9|nr:hypothetical protein EDB82DRAFT_221151 [Fusarium venenatum]
MFVSLIKVANISNILFFVFFCILYKTSALRSLNLPLTSTSLDISPPTRLIATVSFVRSQAKTQPCKYAPILDNLNRHPSTLNPRISITRRFCIHNLAKNLLFFG